MSKETGGPAFPLLAGQKNDGGPLVMPSHPYLPETPQKDFPSWRCPRCGLLSTTLNRSDCLSENSEPLCPMVAPC